MKIVKIKWTETEKRRWTETEKRRFMKRVFHIFDDIELIKKGNTIKTAEQLEEAFINCDECWGE